MMFKKREKTTITILLFLFLLIIPAAIATDYARVKDDWYEYQATFTIGTDIYELQLMPTDFNILRFKQNDIAMLIRVNQCRDEGDFRFCYKNFSFDKKDTIGGGQHMPGVHIEILKAKEPVAPTQKIDVTSTINGNKYLFFEEDASITIKNTGDVSLFNAEIIIDIPQNVTITNRDEFIQVGGQLKKTFTLQKGNEANFDFKYKILSKGAKRFEYKIIHSGETTRTGSFSATGIEPYQVSITTPQKADIREIKEFTVSIKNTHPTEEITLNQLNIKGPVNIQYLTHSNLQQTSYGRFTVPQRILKPNEDLKFTFRYRPLFAGEYTFNVDGEVELEGTYKFLDEKKLSVISEGFSAGLLLARNQISLGADNTITLTLKNDHRSLTFRDINAKITSSIYNTTKTLDFINPGATVKLIEDKINPPQLAENKEYDFNAQITYTNEGGQTETITLSDKFKVLGNNSLISITQKASTTKAKAGDEIIIEVDIQNLVDNQHAQVEIKDTFSQTVEIITGRQTQTTILGSGERKNAYLYKIRVPQKPYSDELIIKTTAKIQSLDYEETKTIKITIEGEIFEELAPPIEEFTEGERESETPSLDDEDAEDIATNDDEGETKDETDANDEGFLKRMVLGIERFFTNLFSRG